MSIYQPVLISLLTCMVMGPVLGGEGYYDSHDMIHVLN